MARNQATTLEGTSLFKKAEGYNEPKSEDIEVVESIMEPSEVFGDIIDVYMDEINRVTRMFRDTTDDFIPVDVLSKYINTLLWMRVEWTRGKLPGSYRDEIMHVVQVPVFISAILDSIGKVEDFTFGIAITPILPENFKDEILSPDETLSISRKLSSIKDDGFKTVEGILKDKTGVLDFMALTVQNGIVKSYRKGTKVYGILAALFTRLCQSEAAGILPRIKFGQVVRYRMDIVSLLETNIEGKD